MELATDLRIRHSEPGLRYPELQKRFYRIIKDSKRPATLVAASALALIGSIFSGCGVNITTPQSTDTGGIIYDCPLPKLLPNSPWNIADGQFSSNQLLITLTEEGQRKITAGEHTIIDEIIKMNGSGSKLEKLLKSGGKNAYPSPSSSTNRMYILNLGGPKEIAEGKIYPLLWGNSYPGSSFVKSDDPKARRIEQATRLIYCSQSQAEEVIASFEPNFLTSIIP